MTVLYVFLILTLVNLILLACPVKVEAGFRDELFLRVGFLFFRYVVAPKKPGKEKKEKAGAEKTKKNRLEELYREKGLAGFLKILGKAAEIAAGAAKEIFRHLVFGRFWLQIRVGGEDAAKTAVDYGHVCGAVGSAVSLLLGCAKYRDCRIDIAPDFRSEQSSVAFDMEAHTAAFFLLRAALRAFFQSVKVIKAAKAAHNS